ncbi:MAG: translation initiation factor 2 [Chromatiaceae bacterium]|nr:translation initiation factor 2 [Gammaproteobacteria bacterium]MCP5304215.1 translation initiation factor 2 [Chromatiaceae bacterium]MCP5313940.1 translation initiation factor 2 [Chromatiaceae bacterium]
MAGEEAGGRNGADDTVLQQQYLRALSSFEGIVLSQIDVKNKLGDRLNYSIRAGLIILFVIAFSILVLLLTLSSQINRISGVVAAMNQHFAAVSQRMDAIAANMASMEVQVAQLESIGGNTTVMQDEIAGIAESAERIEESVADIGVQMTGSRLNVEGIAVTMGAMNIEVQAMNADMHRMAKPARTLNGMIPFP